MRGMDIRLRVGKKIRASISSVMLCRATGCRIRGTKGLLKPICSTKGPAFSLRTIRVSPTAFPVVHFNTRCDFRNAEKVHFDSERWSACATK